MRCQMQFAVGVAGSACMGIAAIEARAVLDLLGESRERCAQLLDDVLLMGREAARAINQRIKQAR